MQLASFEIGARVWLYDSNYVVAALETSADGKSHVRLETESGQARTLMFDALLDQHRIGNVKLMPPKQRGRDGTGKPPRSFSAAEFLANNASQAQLAVAQFRLSVLRWLQEHFPIVRNQVDCEAARKLFESQQVEKAMPERSGLVDFHSFPSWSTLKRWRRRFERTGSASALIPQTSRRGGRNKSRGGEEVESLTSQIIDNYYFNPDRASRRQIHLQLVGEVQALNRDRDASNQLVAPSYATFVRRVASRPAYEAFAARHGKTAAAFKYRQTRTSVAGVVGANVEWQVDHLRMRCIGVDPTNNLPIGRPWVTIITDVGTRAIVEIRASYETPSAARFLDCLRRAILPKSKDELKALQVIGDWPMCGIPLRLRMDNGSDFISDNSLSTLLDLNIEPIYCPVAEPWCKGEIERLNRTTHGGLTGLTGATLPPHIIKELGLDRDKKVLPSMLPLMTCDEINMQLHQWAIDQYMNAPHSALSGNSPISVWKSVITPDRLLLPSSKENLELACMICVRRDVHNYGVAVAGLRTFNNDRLQQVLRARQHTLTARVRVEIRYLPALMDRVWVRDPGDDSWFEVENHDPQTRDLSEHEIGLVRAERRHNRLPDTIEAFAEARKRMADHMLELRNGRRAAGRMAAARATGLVDSSPRAPTAGVPVAKPHPPTARPAGRAVQRKSRTPTAFSAAASADRGVAPRPFPSATSINVPKFNLITS